MTTYYKQLSEFGEVVLLLTYGFTPKITNPLIVEITQEEYSAISAELQAKAEEEAGQTDPDEISDTEALNIILGVTL